MLGPINEYLGSSAHQPLMDALLPFCLWDTQLGQFPHNDHLVRAAAALGWAGAGRGGCACGSRAYCCPCGAPSWSSSPTTAAWCAQWLPCAGQGPAPWSSPGTLELQGAVL